MGETFNAATEADEMRDAANEQFENGDGLHLERLFAELAKDPNKLTAVATKLEQGNSRWSIMPDAEVLHLDNGASLCIRFHRSLPSTNSWTSASDVDRTNFMCAEGIPTGNFNAAKEARILRDEAEVKLYPWAYRDAFKNLDNGTGPESKSLDTSPKFKGYSKLTQDQLKEVAVELEKGNSWFSGEPQAKIIYTNDGEVAGITFIKAVAGDSIGRQTITVY